MKKTIFLVKHGLPQQAFEIRSEASVALEEDQVRIQVHASGVNFADVMARLGLYPEAPRPPSVLGYEVAGVIVEVGSQVNSLQVGQRVLSLTRFGGYSSEVCVSAVGVAVLPDSMGFEEATALGTQWVTAYYAAEEMVRIFPGDRVVVHAAAGGVGSALVQLLRRRGALVMGMASTPEKCAHLRAMGVDHAVIAGPGWAERVRGIVPDVDVIFDSIGGKTFREGWGLLGAGGRLVSFGVASLAGQKSNIGRSVLQLLGFGLYHPLQFLTGSKSVLGVNLLQLADHRPEKLKRCLDAVIELARSGQIRPSMDRVFSPEEIALAHERLSSRQAVGKVVVRW